MFTQFNMQNDLATMYRICPENNFICIELLFTNTLYAIAEKRSSVKRDGEGRETQINTWHLLTGTLYPEEYRNVYDIKQSLNTENGILPNNPALKKVFGQFADLASAIHALQLEYSGHQAALYALPPPKGGTPRPSMPTPSDF